MRWSATAKQRREIPQLYGAKMKPPTAKSMEWVRKHTSRYMFFDNHDNKHGKCECCDNEVEVVKSQHLRGVKCPSCGKTMTAFHLWRRRWILDVDWVAIPKVINGTTLVIRYVVSYVSNSSDGLERKVEECARLVVDYKARKSYPLKKLTDGSWKMSAAGYFQPYIMYTRNRWWCEDAVEYRPTFFREIKRLDCFKYFNVKEFYDRSCTASMNLCNLGNRSDLYEKLIKVGLEDLVQKDWHEIMRGYFSYYTPVLEIDHKQTELHKMLGVTKKHMEIIKKDQSLEGVRFLRQNHNVTEEEYYAMKAMDFSSNSYQRAMELGLDIVKVGEYISKNKIVIGEYLHYAELLQKLDYLRHKANGKLNRKKSKYYLYPKSFRKADEMITAEYKTELSELQNSAIKQISDGLKKMPKLKEFLDGSKGFLVYVPESSQELVNEGKALNNCLRTYPERIAEGKTLIFFIRRLDAPDAPFVAMEYCNGEVIQCRYDHNIDVFTGKDYAGKQVVDVDNNLVDFTNALAEILRKNKVGVA